jgi:protein phosphatase
MLRVADHFERTDTGRQRRANEDSYFARAPLFVVADGMGGAQAGEVASGTAIEAFSGGLPDSGGSAEERLAALAAEANARIHRLSVSDQDLAGMGTTLTAAYVGETEVSLAHVGDSRAYLLRGGELERLTHDHSLVEEFVRQGKLTPAEADEHPQRSIITRALGPEPEVEVDRLSVRGRDGDVFLICSDGLTSMVAEARVAETVAAARSLEDAGLELIAAANEAGGRDNITVILFRLEEVGDGTAAGEETGEHRVPAAQETVAGAAAPTTAEVRAAVAKAPPPAPAAPVDPPRRIDPRPPRGDEPRRRRWAAPLVVVLVVAVPLLGGAYLAGQAVYFLGTTGDGSVAVFHGLPYELPLGLRLYGTDYETGLTPAQLPPARRAKLLDHKLRSHDDARDLARALELGQLATR